MLSTKVRLFNITHLSQILLSLTPITLRAFTGNTYEIASLYETSFPRLTEQFFKSSPWPEAEVVAQYVPSDQLFLFLYKELYFRHIYARVPGGPTIDQRSD